MRLWRLFKCSKAHLLTEGVAGVAGVAAGRVPVVMEAVVRGEGGRAATDPSPPEVAGRGAAGRVAMAMAAGSCRWCCS